jgi:two-component system alkaline phosphatase synthesis response regulator PhoP
MALVLVVDDSPQLRLLVRMTIELDGHQVIEAEDGRVAWCMMRAEVPDLVIMDVSMPGPSGLEVCKAMREDDSFAHVPVIILTAGGLAESERQALANGASAFVAKPFSPLALRAEIEAVLAR